MAYKDPITGEIVSAKTKKKLTTKLKKVKSRVGEIVWWISKDLSLKVGKIVKENPTTFSILLRDEDKVEEVVVAAIQKLGASGMKDMGKVMGLVSKELAGQADGKIISQFVKKHLMS